MTYKQSLFLLLMFSLAGAGCGGGGSSGGSGGSVGSGGGGGSGGGAATGTGGASGIDAAAGSGGSGAGAGSGGGSASDGGGSGGNNTTDAGGTGGAVATTNVFLYVSGYGSADIEVFRFNTTTGALTSVSSATAGSTPTYSVASPSNKFLYVADETSAAAITAYSIASTGALTKLNTVKTSGQGTAHLTVSPDGKWIVAADYDSDSVDVLGINTDGSLAAVSDSQAGCPAAHNVQFDPSGKFLLAACKSDTGKDTPRILQFSFAAGKLTPSNPPAVMFGGDPRHLTFDAAHKHLYAVTEETSQIFWFDYDSTTGKISNPRLVSALDAGGMPGAGGHIAFNGPFLYVANRTDRSIGIFSVDAAGKPVGVAWQRMGTVDVREFSFDPSGKYLLVANQTPSQVTVFKIDAASGKLMPVGSPTAAKSQAATVTVVGLP